MIYEKTNETERILYFKNTKIMELMIEVMFYTFSYKKSDENSFLGKYVESLKRMKGEIFA